MKGTYQERADERDREEIDEDGLDRIRKLRQIWRLKGSMTIEKACEKVGVSRATYHNWQLKYEEGGYGALATQTVDRVAASKSLDHTTSEKTKQAIIGIRLEQPDWSIAKIACALPERGHQKRSLKTVRMILKREKLLNEHDLYNAVWKRYDGTSPSDFQFLCRINAALRDEHLSVSELGHFVVCSKPTGVKQGRTEIYATAAVCLYTGYIVGCAHASNNVQLVEKMFRSIENKLERASASLTRFHVCGSSGRFAGLEHALDAARDRGITIECMIPRSGYIERFFDPLLKKWTPDGRHGLEKLDEHFGRLIGLRNSRQQKWFPSFNTKPVETFCKNGAASESLLKWRERAERLGRLGKLKPCA